MSFDHNYTVRLHAYSRWKGYTANNRSQLAPVRHETVALWRTFCTAFCVHCGWLFRSLRILFILFYFMLAGDVLHTLWVTVGMLCGWHFAQLLGHFRNALWVTFWTPWGSLSECLWVTFWTPCGSLSECLVGEILRNIWVTFRIPCG